jgi:ankyrin repeat protein
MHSCMHAPACVLTRAIYVNSCSQEGRTPLDCCLLENLADRFKRAGADGWTPLHQAVEQGDLEAVMALITQRADVNARLKVRKLHV